jgi:metal-responsive CopG/Arc/MetJ family transcriptional regulator
VLFVFNYLRLEVIVRFVHIGGMSDHHCLEVIVRFVHIGGMSDHHCLEVIVCSVDQGRIQRLC